jgi:hypothetical protein
MKATKKPITIDFYTWEEVVELGKQINPESIHGGMAWNFELEGVNITHENDECYIIPTLEGNHMFTPNDVLIKGVKGELYPCKKDIFEMTYNVDNTALQGETFEDRLVKEFNELKEKAWKLHDFTNSDKFTTIVKEKRQRELLIAQLNAMNVYLYILGFRMEDLKIDDSRYKYA